jgi:RimJ/RimL family protein N-acetyltransferase
MKVSVRRLRLGEGELFRQIRLTSLLESPSAFTTTYETAVKRSPESWSEQADRSAEGPDRATFLLFSDKEPVGIMALYRDLLELDAGELIQVWISPDFRGTGAAGKLMEAVMRWAKKNNFDRIFAEITPGNDRALQFYRKWDFRQMDETKEDGSWSFLVKEI